MSYHTTDPYGVTELNPSEARLESLLKGLQEQDDAEHPDVSLTHDTGWTLTAYPKGTLTWENLSHAEGRRKLLRFLNAEQILEYWLLLASGQIDVIEKLPWEIAD